jgi:hypothetical protein
MTYRATTPELMPKSNCVVRFVPNEAIFHTRLIQATEQGSTFTIDAITVDAHPQLEGSRAASTFCLGQLVDLRDCHRGQEIAFHIRNVGDRPGGLAIKIRDLGGA